MPLTLKEIKKNYLRIYPNSDLTDEQLSDYYYLSQLTLESFRKPPEKIKKILNNERRFGTYTNNLPPITNFNKKVETFRKFYPSKLTNEVLLPIFQVLISDNKNTPLKKIIKNFHPTKFLKKGAHNSYDFEELKKIYQIYNPIKTDSELEDIFYLFHHQQPGESFEDYQRK